METFTKEVYISKKIEFYLPHNVAMSKQKCYNTGLSVEVIAYALFD